MTAKLDLCHTRFSFMENELVFTPNWMAPEGMLHTSVHLDSVLYTHAHAQHTQCILHTYIYVCATVCEMQYSSLSTLIALL